MEVQTEYHFTRNQAALADSRKAADQGEDGAVLHAGTGIALEGLHRHAEADAAFEKAFARPAPEAVRTRIAWIYEFAVPSPTATGWSKRRSIRT